MEPDILLVDEALSAGDAKFKEKAAEKMMSLVAEARTMILVSHALQTVKDMCNDAIWLNKGELMLRGEPNTVVDEYTKFVRVGATAYTLEDM
jgi:ABC-2 type transport system ATP-binding protein/teichoic acid transport system ATP-binding protein